MSRDEGESPAKAAAEAGGPEARFRAFLRAGRLMIQRSPSTGRHVFPPRLVAPGTGEADLEWVEASGLGTVYATTVDRPGGAEAGTAAAAAAAAPRNICLVALDEGPRLMSRVEGIVPEAVTIGLRVRVRIAEADGVPILLFDPAAPPAAPPPNDGGGGGAAPMPPPSPR